MSITMKDLNDRTSALEGKASTTPITMKGLNDRLSNLEATAQKWKEYSFNIPDGTFSNRDYIVNIDSGFDKVVMKACGGRVTLSGQATNLNLTNIGTIRINGNTLVLKTPIGGQYWDASFSVVCFG